MVNVGGYEPNIIREFYANFLKNETSNPESKKYAKTFLRGNSKTIFTFPHNFNYVGILLMLDIFHHLWP